MDCLSGLLDYVRELERDFHQNLTEVGREAGPKVIHGLRLNLKRQKALFRLMEHLDPTFSAKLARQAYGKLYKRIGKVRNLQVEREVVGEDEKLLGLKPDFSAWLQEQEAEAREAVREYEASFSIVNVRRLFSLLRNRLQFVPADAWKARLDAYFRARLTALRLYGIAVPGRERDFHECRRLVKEIGYNLELLHRVCDPADAPIEGLDWLNELQQLLGSWHDRYFSLEHIAAEQPQCPEAIPAQLRAEQRVLADQIDAMLDQLDAQVDALARAWADLLRRQRIAGKAERPARGARGKTHPAFGQLNVSEGTK